MKKYLWLVMVLLLVGTAHALPSQICYPLSTGTMCFNTTTISGVDDYNPGGSDNASWNESYADTLYDPLGGGSDNTSWNESYADTLYSTGAHTTNTNTWWSLVGVYLVNNSGNLWFNDTLLNQTISALDTDTTYSSLSEFADDLGHIEDDTDWNKTYADTLYAVTGSGNSSWNESRGDTIYLGITDQRYNDSGEGDNWQANYTGYNKTSWDIAWGWGDHSGEGYITGYTETDPNWAGNQSNYIATGTSDAWQLVEDNITDLVHTTDTNESTRFSNLVSTCGAGDFRTGVQSNGSAICDTPAGSGDITSVQGDAYITNGADSGAVTLAFNETLMNATCDARDADTTYSALSEFADDLGHVEDDTDWNKSYADTVYAPIGAGSDNTSWNESYAGTLYTAMGTANAWKIVEANITDLAHTVNESVWLTVVATKLDNTNTTANIEELGFTQGAHTTDTNESTWVTALDTKLTNTNTSDNIENLVGAHPTPQNLTEANVDAYVANNGYLLNNTDINITKIELDNGFCITTNTTAIIMGGC